VRRHLWTFALLLLACIGCDHAAKQAAEQWLAGSPGVEWLGGVVRFELAANPGAFLSLGARLPELARDVLLIGLVPVMLAAVGWAVLRAPDPTRAQVGAFALIAGGGLANWLDRLANDGTVTDFVSLGFGPLRTGIFNVADLAIVGGLVVLLAAGAGRRESDAAE
jgi:signal peptidase II